MNFVLTVFIRIKEKLPADPALTEPPGIPQGVPIYYFIISGM